MGRKVVGAADQVVDEERRGPERLFADVVDLGGRQVHRGVNAHRLEHHPAEDAIGRERRNVGDLDRRHALTAEEAAHDLHGLWARGRAARRHLPQLVGQMREERVHDAAAVCALEAVEEHGGRESAGGREDVGLGVARPDLPVERVLDVEALGDRFEHEADLHVGGQVIDAALNDRDAVHDRRDGVGVEASAVGLFELRLHALHGVGEIEGDDGDALGGKQPRKLTKLSKSNVSTGAGDHDCPDGAVVFGLEHGAKMGVGELRHRRQDRVLACFGASVTD